VCQKRRRFIVSRALIVLGGGARGEVELGTLCHVLEYKKDDELGEKRECIL